MKKDWTGNSASVFKTIGASNHADHERADADYYATEPNATKWLLRIETFNRIILEPACGEGHISKELIRGGYDVVSRDLVDRRFGEVADFLSEDNRQWDFDIITNPPYRYAQQFVEKALSIIPEGNKVAMFLKLTFLEGKARRELFRTAPPIRIWVSSRRLKCAMNGDFDGIGGSATAYAWFVWVKGFNGHPTIHWFN